jgi:hypothetical protein
MKVPTQLIHQFHCGGRCKFEGYWSGCRLGEYHKRLGVVAAIVENLAFYIESDQFE